MIKLVASALGSEIHWSMTCSLIFMVDQYRFFSGYVHWTISRWYDFWQLCSSKLCDLDFKLKCKSQRLSWSTGKKSYFFPFLSMEKVSEFSSRNLSWSMSASGGSWNWLWQGMLIQGSRWDLIPQFPDENRALKEYLHYSQINTASMRPCVQKPPEMDMTQNSFKISLFTTQIIPFPSTPLAALNNSTFIKRSEKYISMVVSIELTCFDKNVVLTLRTKT